MELPESGEAQGHSARLQRHKRINRQITRAADSGSVQRLLQLVKTLLPGMNSINLATALHRATKLAVSANEDRLDRLLEHPNFKALVGTIMERVEASAQAIARGQTPPFEVQCMSIVCWAHATLRVQDTKLMATICDIAIPRLHELKPFELSNMAWAYAKLGMAKPEFFRSVSKRMMERREGEFSLQCLSMVCWAFATARHKDPKLLSSLAASIAGMAGTAKPQEIANTLWAYAKTRCQEPVMFKTLGDAALVDGLLWSFKPQELSNTVWAFASVSLQHPALFRLGVSVAISKRRELQPQNCANILWAYAKLQVCRQSGLFPALFALLRCTGTQGRPQHMSQELKALHWAAMHAGYLGNEAEGGGKSWAHELLLQDAQAYYDIVNGEDGGGLEQVEPIGLVNLFRGLITREAAMQSPPANSPSSSTLQYDEQWDNQARRRADSLTYLGSHILDRACEMSHRDLEHILQSLQMLRPSLLQWSPCLVELQLRVDSGLAELRQRNASAPFGHFGQGPDASSDGAVFGSPWDEPSAIRALQTWSNQSVYDADEADAHQWQAQHGSHTPWPRRQSSAAPEADCSGTSPSPGFTNVGQGPAVSPVGSYSGPPHEWTPWVSLDFTRNLNAPFQTLHAAPPAVGAAEPVTIWTGAFPGQTPPGSSGAPRDAPRGPDAAASAGSAPRAPFGGAPLGLDLDGTAWGPPGGVCGGPLPPVRPLDAHSLFAVLPVPPSMGSQRPMPPQTSLFRGPCPALADAPGGDGSPSRMLAEVRGADSEDGLESMLAGLPPPYPYTDPEGAGPLPIGVSHHGGTSVANAVTAAAATALALAAEACADPPSAARPAIPPGAAQEVAEGTWVVREVDVSCLIQCGDGGSEWSSFDIEQHMDESIVGTQGTTVRMRYGIYDERVVIKRVAAPDFAVSWPRVVASAANVLAPSARIIAPGLSRMDCYLVYLHCAGGSLADGLSDKSGNESAFRRDPCRVIVGVMAAALALVESGMDLAPLNAKDIMIDAQGEPRVRLRDGHTRGSAPRPMAGAAAKWASPEEAAGQPGRWPSAAYRLGLLLYCMGAHVQDPYPRKRGDLVLTDLRGEVLGGGRPRRPDLSVYRWPASTVALLEECWSPNPAERPSPLSMGIKIRQAMSSLAQPGAGT